MQNLKTYEKALKEVYLPLWRNQLGVEPSALLSKLRKKPLKGDNIVAAAPMGLSGGFGFSREAQNTPAAGGVRFERFTEHAKDMYVNVCISVKATRLTSSAGAMADALDTEVKAAYETAKWNVGRSLFGNGTGILTTTSACTGSNEITVADTKNLKEGLIVDFYATGSTTPIATGKGRRITAVDRANNTITIEGDPATFSAGFVTVQYSYNNEITGLGAIFDDTVTSLYGVSKTENPIIKPITENAGGDIDNTIIQRALRRAERDKNSKVDLLLCGDKAYDNYTEYTQTNNLRVEQKIGELKGGFKTIQFLFGNRVVDIVNEQFVPDNEIWGVDSTALELHQQEWGFADLQGGGIFNLMENTSVYRALLANYGNLICSNPGGCVRIYNCN